MDEPLSHSNEKEQGELLTIDGDPFVEEPCMFERCMYFSVFYFLCCVKEISIDILEYWVLEEIYPDLNEGYVMGTRRRVPRGFLRTGRLAIKGVQAIWSRRYTA